MQTGIAGVWLVRKIEFSGNWFPLTEKKKGFDYGNKFSFLFSLQMNFGERKREARTHQSTSFAHTKLQSAPFASTSAVDCNLRLRSRLREIAIDASWDRAVNRDLAKRRGASRDRDRRRWCVRMARTGAWCVRTARTGVCVRASLSLSPEFIWSENRNGNSFP